MRASLATVDLFLVCSELELQWEAFELLIKLQEQSKDQERQAIDAVNRLQDMRRRHFQREYPKPPLSVIGSSKHTELCEWILTRGKV